MLSAHQQGLWRVERVVRGSAFQHVASVHHIRGPLDVPALGRAIELLGRRHELLHTGYRAVGDELRDERVDPVPLRTLTVADDAEAAELLQAEHDRPFALEGEPVFRPLLVTTPTASHLTLVLHHLICDAQSFSIIHRDLARFYAHEAGLDDAPPPQPLERQYSDIACAPADPDARARAEAYWREALAGLEEIRFRSQDAAPAPERTFGALSVPVSAEWGQTLDDACRVRRSTPFLVFGAALLAAIAPRIAGTDVRLGAIFLNRLVPGAEDVVGPFAEGMVLRVDTAGAEEDVGALHDRLRGALLDAIDHSALAFDDLVETVDADGFDREKLAPFSLSIATDPESLRLAGVETELAAAAEAREGDAAVALGLHIDLDLKRERCAATFDGAFVSEQEARAVIADALERAVEAAPQRSPAEAV